MILYFSGVKSAKELGMLKLAGVGHVLVDQFDVWSSGVLEWDGHVALDSGAYWAFKHGKVLRTGSYRQALSRLVGMRKFDFIVGLDDIGDPRQSKLNWVDLANRGIVTMPVWQWGADLRDLGFYLQRAPIVGIGGLVQLMRAKDEAMLAHLVHMCSTYPDRFHIFGINWLAAINRLQHLAHSADTSKWLDGARYRVLVFIHSRNRHLAEAPAKALVKSMPEVAEFDRDRLCIESARNMAMFVGSLPLPVGA